MSDHEKTTMELMGEAISRDIDELLPPIAAEKPADATEKWYVDVVSFETEKVIRRIPVDGSERKADRVDRGLQHNLDHTRYFTVIRNEAQAAAVEIDASAHP